MKRRFSWVASLVLVILMLGSALAQSTPPPCYTTYDGCNFASYQYVAEFWGTRDGVKQKACEAAVYTCSVLGGTSSQCYVVDRGWSPIVGEWINVKVCCTDACSTTSDPCEGYDLTLCGDYIIGGDPNAPPEGCCPSPILIDVAGDGFNLTAAPFGVRFDLNRDGKPEQIAWTSQGSDDSFLVLDRNGNGWVDDGSELFGNYTPQPDSPSKNGFLALAEYDSNSDGRIDHLDRVFQSLKLWRDANHNGVSEFFELNGLAERGLTAIDLGYRDSRRRDEFGNAFRYRAKVYDVAGSNVGRWAYDVFLAKQRQ